jgi:hypothetical protein
MLREPEKKNSRVSATAPGAVFRAFMENPNGRKGFKRLA